MERRVGASTDNSDGQRDSGNGYWTAATFCTVSFCCPRERREQHPDRRGVLQDDGNGYARLLDGNVIEIIRDGHTQDSENQALDEIGPGELDATPYRRARCKQREKDQERERCSGLRQKQWVDGVLDLSRQLEFPGEDGASHGGG